MSHRYRVAFRETLCGKRKSYYQNNGFSREAQSSVRETMITGAGGYDNSQLVSKIVYLLYIEKFIMFVRLVGRLWCFSYKFITDKKKQNNSKEQ